VSANGMGESNTKPTEQAFAQT